MAQGPCRLLQAAWLFLWALFPQVLHALPVLEGVSIEQAPILGQPLDVRISIAGVTEWRALAGNQADAADIAGEIDPRWRLLESDAGSSRRYAWSSDARVEEPVLRLVVVNVADPNDQRVLTLLPELPRSTSVVQIVPNQGVGIPDGVFVARASSSFIDQPSMPRLELLQPQAGEQLRDSERMRLLQLETEALLLRESLAAFEDEQARLRLRMQEAEAVALASEQRLRDAREEVERLRDMLYARDAALEALRDKVWMTLGFGLLVLFMVVLGFVLWWRSELPDRKLRQEARARMEWRSAQSEVEQAEVAESQTDLQSDSAGQTQQQTIVASVSSAPASMPASPQTAAADPFLLDMVRAHLDLGDVAAADATLQLLEQSTGDDSRVLTMRKEIQERISATDNH